MTINPFDFHPLLMYHIIKLKLYTCKGYSQIPFGFADVCAAAFCNISIWGFYEKNMCLAKDQWNSNAFAD
jgi:hypothetical protein